MNYAGKYKVVQSAWQTIMKQVCCVAENHNNPSAEAVLGAPDHATDSRKDGVDGSASEPF
eukprot:1161417-Pelagomonas_calceolata.AAC.6